MCWLAMSAIWNLARPERCREQFEKSVLSLISQVLRTHFKVHLVVETALGALSNLVLYEELRMECGNSEESMLPLIISVINEHDGFSF